MRVIFILLLLKTISSFPVPPEYASIVCYIINPFSVQPVVNPILTAILSNVSAFLRVFSQSIPWKQLRLLP